MESYVERFAREQKEKAQKEAESRKPKKGRKVKEVQKDGTDTRSEGHETQEDSNGGE